MMKKQYESPKEIFIETVDVLTTSGLDQPWEADKSKWDILSVGVGL